MRHNITHRKDVLLGGLLILALLTMGCSVCTMVQGLGKGVALTAVATVQTQIAEGEPYECDRHGYMVVVEPGDTPEDLERVTGFALLEDAFGEFRFGDPDFTPAAEVIEDHGGCCYEIGYVLNDDGYAVALFLPTSDGVDPELLAMCARFSVPVVEPIVP